MVSGKRSQKGRFWSLNQRPRISEHIPKSASLIPKQNAGGPDRKADVKPLLEISFLHFFNITTPIWRTRILHSLIPRMPQTKKRWSRLVCCMKCCYRQVLTSPMNVDPEKTPREITGLDSHQVRAAFRSKYGRSSKYQFPFSSTGCRAFRQT